MSAMHEYIILPAIPTYLMKHIIQLDKVIYKLFTGA